MVRRPRYLSGLPDAIAASGTRSEGSASVPLRGRLAASNLYFVPSLFQLPFDPLADIPLDLYDPLADRPACAAQALEVTRQRVQGPRHPGDERDGLPTAAFAIAQQAHKPVARQVQRRLSSSRPTLASTRRLRQWSI